MRDFIVALAVLGLVAACGAASSGVLIVNHSVRNWTSYAGPTAFHPGYPYLREGLLVENFEGYQQWALGIQGTPALRVFTLGSPSRLVVDVSAI